MPYVPTKRLPPLATMRQIAREERHAALKDGGMFVQALAAKYPPKADSSSYARTGTLGKSIATSEVFDAVRSSWIEVGTNKHYAPFVEYGTGIYRETAIGVSAGGDVIRPKSAKALAWRSQGKQMGPGGRMIGSGLRRKRGKLTHDAGRDQYMNFAAFVRGIKPWHFMERAFTAPETEAYLKHRFETMLSRIEARMNES